VLADIDALIKKISQRAGIPEEEVKRRIEEKMKEFAGLLTEAGATYAVAKELGVEIDLDRELSRRVLIGQIEPGMERIDVMGRVLRIYPPKTFQKNGRTGKYCRIIIGDKSGSIRVTLWNRDVELVEKGKIRIGDVVEVINGYAEEYNGQTALRLSFDSRLLVNPEGVDVEAPESWEPHTSTAQLAEGQNNVNIILRVLRAYPPREVETSFGKTKMRAFIGADKDGTVRVVLWGDNAELDLQEGDVIEIINGYTRQGTAGINVHVGRSGYARKREDLREQFQAVAGRSRTETITPIAEVEDGEWATIRGIVVQIYRITPITAFCNVCGARATWENGEWVCTACGSKDVRTSPAASIEVDDGTGVIRVIAFGDAARQLYGKNEPTNPNDDPKQMLEHLLGDEVTIRGRVSERSDGQREMRAFRIGRPDYQQIVKRELEEVERMVGTD